MTTLGVLESVAFKAAGPIRHLLGDNLRRISVTGAHHSGGHEPDLVFYCTLENRSKKDFGVDEIRIAFGIEKDSVLAERTVHERDLLSGEHASVNVTMADYDSRRAELAKANCWAEARWKDWWVVPRKSRTTPLNMVELPPA